MRKEVLKGVGGAMVLSLVAFGAIAVDRTVRSAPAHANPAPVSVPQGVVAPVAEPVAVAAVAAPAPQPVTRPASTPTTTSVKPAVRLDPVPAPPSLPPFTEAVVYAHPAPPKVTPVGQLPEFRAALADPPAPVPAAAQNPDFVTNHPEADDKAPTANPAVRAVRSVGRVLGIGRKDGK